MGNSKLRPETGSGRDKPLLSGTAAYYACLNAVETQEGLIHGRLRDGQGHFCAIGSLWEACPNVALESSFIDEIAAINDSVAPGKQGVTPRRRREAVRRYLKWKLAQLGFRLQGGQVKTP